jgi:hypothetical protein
MWPNFDLSIPRLDLTPALSSRRGRIIGRLTEKAAAAYAG